MDPVAIANLALGWLGCERIASFEDPSRSALLINEAFEGLRDAVLEDRDWTFATSRLSLLKDATPPTFGFSARYVIPSTVIRLITVEAESGYPATWVREGRFVLAYENADTMNAVAIVQVEDPALWTPGFCQALAARIASDLAIPLTENRTLQGDMWALYQRKLRDAAANDGRQGRTRIPRASFLADRRR